ncbi:MAG: HAMP domain-containing histidine kinase [Ignavibacteria bacterium]|nr:HAMP domain-containing histidine kinase [Ignavibacteria bacterium]
MNKFGSFRIKIALLIAGVLIALGILLYTQSIINKIRARESQIAELFAKSIEYTANDTSLTGEYAFIFNEIILQIDFPIVATDREYKRVDFFKNIDVDTTLPKEKLNSVLLELATDLAKNKPPIKVSYQDSILLNLVHYGESDLIRKLKILPILELLIGGFFIIIGYIGFSYIKKHEQSSIWVGLSKETAHQLGTPLSSLLGWLEILKSSEIKDSTSKEVIKEIENDLEKLKKIASRFSKIGSTPELKNENIKELIKEVTQYFERRIPSLIKTDGSTEKKISIEINSPDEIYAKVNKDLFEWVIENMLKNSVDAIDKTSGKIIFNIYKKEKDIIIDIKDNGKGIDIKFRKDIFRPGYSTKKRGWGLGLTLAKRIIEDYHKGKLTLVESIVDKGTTFRIRLKEN